MDELAKAVAVSIGAMPPVMAAGVMVIAGAGVLAYFWRRAGIEANRERMAAKDTVDTQLKRIADGQEHITDTLQDISKTLAVLMDRGKR